MFMRQVSRGLSDEAIAEFFKSYSEPERRRAALDLYRSGDFAKLEPYDGRLAALGVRALIVWGAKDEFAPIGGAYRFKKQLPNARLVVLEDAGHYVMEDEPEKVGAELRSFLEGL
jgi:haloalkane dehalogenase